MRLNGGRPMFVVATALVLACSLVGCGDSTDRDSTDPVDPSLSSAVSAGEDPGCPSSETEIAYPPDGRLPADAVGVRLCNVGEDGEAQFDVQAPADELTTDVGTLVDLVNSLGEPPAETACTLEAGPDLVFWFRYADGQSHAVRYGQYGCRTVFVGPEAQRLGGEDLHATFAELLASQRTSATPTGTPPEPDCAVDPPTAAMDIVPALDLASAAICRSDRNGGWKEGALLTLEEIYLVNEDWDPQAPAKGTGCPGGKVTLTKLTGFTAWGDLVSLYGRGCSYGFASVRRDQSQLVWQPSPKVAGMLVRLAESSRSKPVS